MLFIETAVDSLSLIILVKIFLVHSTNEIGLVSARSCDQITFFGMSVIMVLDQ
jgi:hypothetical protein